MNRKRTVRSNAMYAIMGGKTGLLVIETKKNKLRLCLAHALHYLCV